GMRRNRIEDLDPTCFVEIERAPHHIEMALDAIAFGTRDPRCRRPFDRDAGLEIADGDADAAEAAAECAVEIEEPEMQPRRNGDRHGRSAPRCGLVHASAPGFFPGAGFAMSITGLDCVTETRLAIAVGNRS